MIRAHWEKARVSQCTRVQPWVDLFQSARRTESVQPSRAALSVNADWTGQHMCPLEKPRWRESDLYSPLARLRALLAMHTQSSSRGEDYTSFHALPVCSRWLHCQLDRPIEMDSQQAGMSGNYDFVPIWPKRRQATWLQFVRSLTYPRYISGCLVQRGLFTSDRFKRKQLTLYTRRMWMSVRSLILFSVCSTTGLMLI